MRSLRDAAARRALIARVDRLSPSSQARWGQMDVGRMLAHAADQLRVALGDIPVEGTRGPLRFAPTRFLIVHALPWPKGRAQAPRETFTSLPGEFEADQARLTTLIERFAAAPPDDLAAVNPIFGRMTAHDWDVLSFRHLDHHLRQFGV
jgi:Protein of unknown function (DUF1569)